MLSPILFGWLWMIGGVLSGAALGLFFAREDWLGGYASWPRRMLRLGHIAFFGTGLLNLAAGLTAQAAGQSLPLWGHWGLLIGAVGMPLLCLTSAFMRWTRHLFFVPVSGLGLGVISIVLMGGL